MHRTLPTGERVGAVVVDQDVDYTPDEGYSATQPTKSVLAGPQQQLIIGKDHRAQVLHIGGRVLGDGLQHLVHCVAKALDVEIFAGASQLAFVVRLELPLGDSPISQQSLLASQVGAQVVALETLDCHARVVRETQAIHHTPIGAHIDYRLDQLPMQEYPRGSGCRR
jgi:hypothetical protein